MMVVMLQMREGPWQSMHWPETVQGLGSFRRLLLIGQAYNLVLSRAAAKSGATLLTPMTIITFFRPIDHRGDPIADAVHINELAA